MKIPLQRQSRTSLSAGMLVWLVVVAWCTLRPLQGINLARHQPVAWDCLVCGDGGISDVILNLLLFLPLGVFAYLLKWSPGRCLGFAIAATTAIELTQGFFLAGRDGSLSDVIANSSGAFGGWYLARSLSIHPADPGRTATRRAAVVLILHLIVWFGSAFLLTPDVTGPTPWHARYLPMDTSALMTAHSAQVDDIPLTRDSSLPFPGPGNAKELRLTFTQHSLNGALSAINVVRVRDSLAEEVISLSTSGSGATLGIRLNASRLLLRTPGWTFPTTGSVQLEARTQMHWQWQAEGIRLAIAPEDSLSETHTFSQPFSVTFGWSLVHPFVRNINESSRLWSVLWLIWWFGLLGYLAAPSGMLRSLLFGVAGVAIMVGASLSSGWPLTGTELAAALVGFGVARTVNGER